VRPSYLLPGTILCIGFLASPAQSALLIDMGGGLHVPFEGEQRDDYGTAPSVSLGAALALGGQRTWAFLDVGYTWDSGEEFTPDPTFDAEDTEYGLVPITLGVRTDFMKPGLSDHVGIFGGLAWQTVLTRWEFPFGRHESTPTVGVLFELRPEVKLASRWRVWLRQRVSLLGSSDYGNIVRGRNVSGSTIHAGLSWGPQP
jgi:hypothetical protein